MQRFRQRNRIAGYDTWTFSTADAGDFESMGEEDPPGDRAVECGQRILDASDPRGAAGVGRK